MISIITATWNRADLLGRLYESLVNQTNNNFEWVIVDDGSKDNTEQLVENWIKENKIKIYFFKQENGGKHRALNTALDHVNGEFSFIVDSDDYLTTDAVEIIERDIQLIKEDERLSGIGYLRATPEGDIIGKPYTVDGIRDTFNNQRYNKGTIGDKAEVYKTDILKKNKFPEYENEKFLSEAVIWCKISESYEMLFFNKKIYLCDYQAGGLSDNVRKRLLRNPKGACECYRVMCGKQFNLKKKIKHLMLYICHGIEDGRTRKELKNGVDCKFLFALMYLPGKLLHCKRKKLLGSK